ncbi:MAG: hypothetical protein J0I41_02545 [Filimonas sp.]|nr:hypothetical protein [Filimonas sp.]
MYNIKINILVLTILLAVAACFTACKKESALTPETVFNGGIKLPQGWSKYDTTIQSFYDSTGTYIGYKFDNEADLRFFMMGIPNMPLSIAPPVLAVQVDSSKQGDIDTLNMAVDYVINGLLRKSYSNKLLKQLLPYKILLYKYGRALIDNKTKPTAFDTTSIANSILGSVSSANNMVEGFNNIGLGIIRQMSSFSLPAGYSTSDKASFHQLLWVGTGSSGAIARGKIKIAPGFDITDYATLTNLWTNLPLPRSGATVDSLCQASGTLTYMKNAQLDYASFIKNIATRTPDSFANLYLGARDPNGIRQKKRDAVIAFFKNEYNYNIENAWNQ